MLNRPEKKPEQRALLERTPNPASPDAYYLDPEGSELTDALYKAASALGQRLAHQLSKSVHPFVPAVVAPGRMLYVPQPVRKGLSLAQVAIAANQAGMPALQVPQRQMTNRIVKLLTCPHIMHSLKGACIEAVRSGFLRDYHIDNPPGEPEPEGEYKDKPDAESMLVMDHCLVLVTLHTVLTATYDLQEAHESANRHYAEAMVVLESLEALQAAHHAHIDHPEEEFDLPDILATPEADDAKRRLQVENKQVDAAAPRPGAKQITQLEEFKLAKLVAAMHADPELAHDIKAVEAAAAPLPKIKRGPAAATGQALVAAQLRRQAEALAHLARAHEARQALLAFLSRAHVHVHRTVLRPAEVAEYLNRLHRGPNVWVRPLYMRAMALAPWKAAKAQARPPHMLTYVPR